MKRLVHAIALTGLMTLGAGLLAAPPAAAATPPQVSHQRLSDSFTTEVCGFTVNNVIKGMVTFKTTVDAAGTASYQSEAHVVQRMTNPVNGKVVYLDNSGRDAFSDGGVLNADGTTTFTDTLTGTDMRVYTSHSSVLLKDHGYTAIVDTVDPDGNLISEQFINHGPHQFAGDQSAFCDAIATAIG
jgi:hypothetical protein